MQKTNIGWTDFSANLIKYRDPDGNVVQACVKASEGCRYCYAEALAWRWGRKGRKFTAENMKRLTPFFDEKEAKRVLGSKQITGKRVFVNDMTDWMGPWVSDDVIDLCLAIFALRPDATFQTLTKHADRQRRHFLRTGSRDNVSRWLNDLPVPLPNWMNRIASSLYDGSGHRRLEVWPLGNLHLGISVEDQKNADGRIPELMNTPAAVRWVSAEPLLGPLDFGYRGSCDHIRHSCEDIGCWKALDWVVVGGETGPRRRAVPLHYYTSIIDQCRAADIPVFVKQDSGARPGQQGRIPDEYWLKEFPK